MITAELFTHSNTSAPIYMPRKNISTIRFNTEAQLVSLFEGIVGHKIDQNSSGLISEFECGDGIADIVLYELHKGWNNSLILGEIPTRWMYALRNLPYRKNFTTIDFISRTNVTRNTALQMLNHYAELGFCEIKNKPDTWAKIIQPKQIINNIIAVEAKLKHWQRALTQAVRYRDYANQSWVLLDEHNTRPAIKNIEQFERLNIGLASLSTSGNITTYLVPQHSIPKSTLRFWQANAEIARRLISPL
jgi:hypothetical protein